MSKRHVIVGAGVAGLAAARDLRQLDREASIALVGNERPYARMVLPYLMGERIEERAVFTGDDAHFKELGVETFFGEGVERIDAGAHRVGLARGQSLDYDALLIATGSRAARPPIPGAEQDGVLAMWTLDDARRFLAGPHRDVVIVGAGFIAFTILDAVLHQAENVHLVEMEAQILPHMLDATAASLMQARLRERGLHVHTDCQVRSIDGTGKRKKLALSSGESIEADAVILSTGIQPNLDLVRGTDIETDAGILVDGRMRTSTEGVYAAGDVAQGPVLHLDERRVHAIQPTSADHGRVAAANMAGQEVVYEGSLIMNILASQGLEAASFGLWGDESLESTRVENARGHIYRRYVWREDRLVGGALVGPNHAVSGLNDVGMLKGLIQTGVELGPWKPYLQNNPLDLRRVFAASGAAERLAGSSMLAGRIAGGGRFRAGGEAAQRPRSPHHATLLTGAP